jgi:hypothetical protein
MGSLSAAARAQRYYRTSLSFLPTPPWVRADSWPLALDLYLIDAPPRRPLPFCRIEKEGLQAMYGDAMLALLLISSGCAVGLAIIAMEYMDEVVASEAGLMKYGVIVQIWATMALCIIRFEFPGSEFFLHLMPILALLGFGIFMLGALSVFKAMARARYLFLVLASGVQLCVLAFITCTAMMLP